MQEALVELSADHFAECVRVADAHIMEQARARYIVIEDYMQSEQAGEPLELMKMTVGVRGAREIFQTLEKETDLSRDFLARAYETLTVYEERLKAQRKTSASEQELFDAFEQKHPHIIEMLELRNTVKERFATMKIAIKALQEDDETVYNWLTKKVSKLWPKKEWNERLDVLVAEIGTIPPEEYPDTKTKERIERSLQQGVDLVEELLNFSDRAQEKKTEPPEWEEAMRVNAQIFFAEETAVEDRWLAVSDLAHAALYSGAQPNVNDLCMAINTAVGTPGSPTALSKQQRAHLEAQISLFLQEYERQQGRPFGEEGLEKED